MRVVFDTNIFVSAFVLPGSQAESALMRIADGTDRLIVSKAIINELLDVLSRKFARDADELARVAVFLADAAEMTSPRSRIRVLADDPDNRILECARAAKAQIVVTGDKAMLRLRKFKDVRIVSLRRYLDQPG